LVAHALPASQYSQMGKEREAEEQSPPPLHVAIDVPRRLVARDTAILCRGRRGCQFGGGAGV